MEGAAGGTRRLVGTRGLCEGECSAGSGQGTRVRPSAKEQPAAVPGSRLRRGNTEGGGVPAPRFGKMGSVGSDLERRRAGSTDMQA